MSKIFISYRREDSIDVTGRIHDRLVKDFGLGAVFMDVDSIPYGVDFRTYLDEQVGQCQVFLAVIGLDWLRGKERQGRSRLENPRDFVRIEIESALKRRIPVIPVLVGGASVPSAQQLPASIQDLSYRHAIVIRPNPDFHRDMDRLINYLRTQFDGEKEQLVHLAAQDMVGDVSGAEGTGYSKVEPPGVISDEVEARPLGRDPQQQGVEQSEEQRGTSSATSKTTTDYSPAYVLGGIGLIVLIGAVVAFLILQPKPTPVSSPPVAEKKEERLAQVIPPPSPPRSAELVAVPKRQAASAEKQIIANKPPKVTEKKEESIARKISPSSSRPSEPDAAPRKQSVSMEKLVMANQPSKPAEKQEVPTVGEIPPASPRPSDPVAVPQKKDVSGEKQVSARQPSIPAQEMIRISPGSFMMGGSKTGEGPLHEIRFTKPFAMARYETTFDEYDRFAQATGRLLPADNGWGRGSRPVIYVSWYEAKAYAQWLSQQTGKSYRLPTEAEWEYTARSDGKDETWAGTSDHNQLTEYAVYGAKRTELVGRKNPNGLGLYDMSGNVWEWVEDCWHEDYKGAPENGSAWLGINGGDCSYRVIRGGSWYNGPEFLRASSRLKHFLGFPDLSIGFRLVQELP